MYENNHPRQPFQRNAMAAAALVLGIISLMCCALLYISVPCGALAVICAVLSRSSSPMPGQSKAGLVCGICGIAASVILSAVTVWTVLSDPQMKSYMEELIQWYVGEDTQEPYPREDSDPPDEALPFRVEEEEVFL